jgi:hypothetical protein
VRGVSRIPGTNRAERWCWTRWKRPACRRRHAPTRTAARRAELLKEISRAQDKRAEAWRDWAEDTIDKEDWLDVKQRTEARITKARREYDKLAGSVTVFGDIPASDMVRDAWNDWIPAGGARPSKSFMN